MNVDIQNFVKLFYSFSRIRWVRSFVTLPVLMADLGSKTIAQTSSSATERCSIPLGTIFVEMPDEFAEKFNELDVLTV
jgi:hypothetical protein